MANEVVGGQAVIEGVMMMNGSRQGVAVRDPKGENFLLGKRAQSSEYKPGNYTIPGGMFEVDDSVDS